VVADLPNDDPRPGGVVLGDLESTLVEVVVLALFVVFWLVETAELWDQGIPPPAPNGGVSRCRPRPCSVGPRGNDGTLSWRVQRCDPRPTIRTFCGYLEAASWRAT
jgi:hypothetical protein